MDQTGRSQSHVTRASLTVTCRVCVCTHHNDHGSVNLVGERHSHRHRKHARATKKQACDQSHASTKPAGTRKAITAHEWTNARVNSHNHVSKTVTNTSPTHIHRNTAVRTCKRAKKQHRNKCLETHARKRKNRNRCTITKIRTHHQNACPFTRPRSTKQKKRYAGSWILLSSK